MSSKAKCSLCGEPMPAGEEMFKYHGYSGPCPTPAPKPPQKATCETHGHIYGHEGVCLFCRTPKPTPEPQTVCEWHKSPNKLYADAGCRPSAFFEVIAVEEWEQCPYCGKPLKLSPESPSQQPASVTVAEPVDLMKALRKGLEARLGLSPESPNEGAK